MPRAPPAPHCHPQSQSLDLGTWGLSSRSPRAQGPVRRGWGDIVRGQAISPPQPVSLTVQGLEIVNPQAAEKKVAEANQKYFSSMAEFLKVKGEKSGIMST